MRQILGLEHARYIMTGSAPTPVDVHQWFLAQGIALREGYGLTETLGSGAYWLHDDPPQPGSIGRTHPGVEIRLAADGEVLVRSEGMMLGYYLDAEHSAKVLRDGWLYTGDLATQDSAGNLRISGRKGDIFKTAKGKFVQPKLLEQHFNTLAELEQLIVIGSGLPQPVLLANLSADGRRLSADVFTQQVTQAITAINAQLASHERIRQLIITQREWTAANGLLTPTLKIRRPMIEAAYRTHIEQAADTPTITWLNDAETALA